MHYIISYILYNNIKERIRPKCVFSYIYMVMYTYDNTLWRRRQHCVWLQRAHLYIYIYISSDYIILCIIIRGAVWATVIVIMQLRIMYNILYDRRTIAGCCGHNPTTGLCAQVPTPAELTMMWLSSVWYRRPGLIGCSSMKLTTVDIPRQQVLPRGTQY